MTSILKNVYIDKVTDVGNKYNNTYHSIINMKLAVVKSNTYIDVSMENNEKNSKFNVSDHVRISKYKNIFAKGLCSKLVWRSFWD